MRAPNVQVPMVQDVMQHSAVCSCARDKTGESPAPECDGTRHLPCQVNEVFLCGLDLLLKGFSEVFDTPFVNRLVIDHAYPGPNFLVARLFCLVIHH